MRIITCTSDKYTWLLTSFSDYFNRYWGKVPVTVLGFEPPKSQMPSNFEFVSLGKQPPNKDWTTGLIPYFRTFSEDYFVLLLDDYSLTHVDHKLLEQAEKIVKADRQVQKFDLTDDRYKFPHIELNGSNIIHSAQDARYRSSLQAAIWRTKYFKKLLIAGRTPWEFELEGSKERINDGALIMGTKTGIVKYINKCLKGCVTQK